MNSYRPYTPRLMTLVISNLNRSRIWEARVRLPHHILPTWPTPNPYIFLHVCSPDQTLATLHSPSFHPSSSLPSISGLLRHGGKRIRVLRHPICGLRPRHSLARGGDSARIPHEARLCCHVKDGAIHLASVRRARGVTALLVCRVGSPHVRIYDLCKRTRGLSNVELINFR